MTARARRMSCGIALAGLLLGGGMTLFLCRSQAANGLSGQDVAQIRKLVRNEVWRQFTLHPWSLANLRHMPRQLWRTCRARIDQPTQWQNMHTLQPGYYPDPNDTWLVQTSNGGCSSSISSTAVGRSSRGRMGVTCSTFVLRTIGCMWRTLCAFALLRFSSPIGPPR